MAASPHREDPRRRLLVKILASSLAFGSLSVPGVAAAQIFGRRPGKLAEGQSIYDVTGPVMVNGKLIQGRHYLHHEDELRLHDIIFRVTEVQDHRRRERDSLNQTTFLDVGLVTSPGLAPTSDTGPDGGPSR